MNMNKVSVFKYRINRIIESLHQSSFQVMPIFDFFDKNIVRDVFKACKRLIQNNEIVLKLRIKQRVRKISKTKTA